VVNGTENEKNYRLYNGLIVEYLRHIVAVYYLVNKPSYFTMGKV